MKALEQCSFEAHSSLQTMAKRFRLDACKRKPPLEPPMKIPRASDVNTGAMQSVPPPQALLERLGNPPIIIGFDIVPALELGRESTLQAHIMFRHACGHDALRKHTTGMRTRTTSTKSDSLASTPESTTQGYDSRGSCTSDTRPELWMRKSPPRNST